MENFAPYKDRKEHEYINAMTVIINRLYLSIATGEKAVTEAKRTVEDLKVVIDNHIRFARRERGPRMKVVVAAYTYNKKLHNALISLWTWPPNINTPPTSHIEVGFKKDGIFQFFSSTNRGDASGTRWEDLYTVVKHPGRWKFYEKDFPESEVLDMTNRANSILDLPYDWWGIGGFATITGQLNAKDKWYCSEACWFVMLGDWIKRISPRNLVKRILKIGFKELSYKSLIHYIKGGRDETEKIAS